MYMLKKLYGRNFDVQGQFVVFVNMLLYGKSLYIESISLWNIFYKLIESYLKATALSFGPKRLSEGFS